MNDLRVILFEITQKCNARCEHCGSRCDINCEELLTKEDIVSCLEDVKKKIGTDMMINISGGEPLMRKDLFEIMSEVSSMGFDWGMVTNGTLINDDVIQKMKTSGMKTITISIDGMKYTHEKLRHLPGSFDVIIKNLYKLKEANFLDHLQVTFTANKENVYEFPSLYEKLDAIGIDSIRTSCVDAIGRAEDNKTLLLEKNDLQFMFDFINNVNKQKRTPIVWGCCHYLYNKLDNRTFECFAGTHLASVLYNGDIYVCPNVPRVKELIQGNIKIDSLADKWIHGFEPFRNRKTNEDCENCKYFKDCKGDSLHTWDFENNKPKFCYKEIFDTQEDEYKNYLSKKYPNYQITSIDSNDVADNIYIEPEAYEDLKQYFHMGKSHPVSIYEQQVGLVGFKIDSGYVIKYIFPSITNRLNEEMSFFTTQTMKQAQKETNIIKNNFKKSDDREDYIADGLMFLGFAHSHPIQKELCYSVGDEILHKMIIKKNGDYIGILIYPKDELIGAYYGKDIKQGNLKIVEK